MPSPNAIRPGKGEHVRRACKAAHFVITRATFTTLELAEHLGVAKSNARNYLDSLSIDLPIYEVEPMRYTSDGPQPAVYAVDPEWVAIMSQRKEPAHG